MVFCQAKNGLIDPTQSFQELLINREKFDNYTQAVDITFMGIAVNKNGQYENKTEIPIRKDLYTLGLGKCVLFEVEGRFWSKEYVMFGVNFTAGPVLVFLTNRGEEFGIAMAFPRSELHPVTISGPTVNSRSTFAF